MNKLKNNHTRLWKKGLSLLCIASLAIVPLSGCTLKSAYRKGEENTQGEFDIYQKMELSEKEMDQSHFTMDDFKEKVKIDAKITPYHLYQDGVGTYYNLNGKLFDWDADSKLVKLNKKVQDAGAEDLTYFGKSAREIVEVLETAGGRKAQMEKMSWKFKKKYGDHQVSVPFVKEGDKDNVVLEMQWGCPADEDDNPLLNKKKTYCDGFSMANEMGKTAQNMVNWIQYCGGGMSYQAEKSLDFADNMETAQMLKEMLTKLTGYEFSEDYDVIPVDSAVMDEALKNAEQEQHKMDLSQMKPFYYYRFYQELDGLSIRNSTQSIMADENTNLSEELRKEIEGKDTYYAKAQIDNYCSAYAEIIYDETGIIFLDLGEEFVDTEPREGKKPVLGLSDLLESLYEYFDTVVCIDTTVLEIRLGYIGNFTDGADEPIRRILEPVWIVKYDTKINGKRNQVKCFDGYTGAPLQVSINYLW